MFVADGLIERLGVRVIAVDRPGCGMSGFQKKRTISEWPSDIAVLADYLGIDRFSVLGWSGGGVYALACAFSLRDRVSAAGVVSGMGPHDVPGLSDAINPQSMRFFEMNTDRPFIGRMVDRLMAFGARRDPGAFLAKTMAALPPIDQQAMSDPGVGRAYVDAVRECFRSGPHGGQVDTLLVTSPWGFDPRAIESTVSLWHGDEDVDAPVAMGHWMADAIPRCESHFLSGEGHISLIVNNVEPILLALVS